MKAVFQNTMIGLLYLAGIVLAAPTQSMSNPSSLQNMQNPATVKMAELTQVEGVGNCTDTVPAPSIEEGTVRFACW